MADETVTTFNAGASMLGYLYQVRVALLWVIRQSRVGDFSVNLETLDDVSFESHGDPVALLQTKHSILSTSGLGDLSPDLWKTLRIWMVGRRSGEVDQWGDLATTYAGQLAAYRDVLQAASGLPVEEMWLILPVAGAALQVEVG